MENFLASRPSIAKLGVHPKTAAHPFASLASRPASRTGATSLSDAAGAPTSADPASRDHEAKVELVRENGAVQRIVIVCKCGERVELDCVY